MPKVDINAHGTTGRAATTAVLSPIVWAAEASRHRLPPATSSGVAAATRHATKFTAAAAGREPCEAKPSAHAWRRPTNTTARRQATFSEAVTGPRYFGLISNKAQEHDVVLKGDQSDGRCHGDDDDSKRAPERALDRQRPMALRPILRWPCRRLAVRRQRTSSPSVPSRSIAFPGESAPVASKRVLCPVRRGSLGGGSAALPPGRRT